MDKALFQQLNQVYAPLRGRASRLARALAEKGLKAEWGWYANHFVKVDGEYQAEEFPIPVIEVQGLCEIGLNLDECWVEFQLSRKAALSFDWEQLPEGAEVYGVAQYLVDFYTAGMDRAGIAGRIAQSAEQTVNIALPFPSQVEEGTLLAAAENCRRWKNGEKP